jgi:hypothetical protein
MKTAELFVISEVAVVPTGVVTKQWDMLELVQHLLQTALVFAKLTVDTAWFIHMVVIQCVIVHTFMQ